jgi:hypothetical protein
MKIATKRIGLIFLIIAALCVFHMITPTFGLQIPFNEWVWKNDPNHRIRYYMSESLVEKLNTEKPDIMQTADMLGQESMGGSRITSGDTHVTYFLMTPPFYLIGLATYTLEIGFTNDGSFQSAKVVFSD